MECISSPIPQSAGLDISSKLNFGHAPLQPWSQIHPGVGADPTRNPSCRRETVGTRQEKTELGFGSVLPILLQWCLCGVAVWDLPWPLHSHEVS